MPTPVLQFFEYRHLTSPILQEVSAPFCALARQLAETLPDNRQRELALEMLLAAKDCAVRSALAAMPKAVG